MAHGLPDYYRGVDIAYQALAQMIVRPKYGGAIKSSGTGVVTASSLNTLLTVSGKGMIYGGYFYLDHESSQNNSAPRLEVDSEVIAYIRFNEASKYHIYQPRCHPLVELVYDDANFIYSMGISYGFTFETEVKLGYLEDHGATPTVSHNLIYALV